MTYAAELMNRARKRAAYRRTVRELGALDRNTRLDLDIYEGDIPRIAQKAVYGAWIGAFQRPAGCLVSRPCVDAWP